MGSWLRWMRGALGMGLAWGLTWFGAGMLMLLGMVITTGSTGADVPYPVGFGALGFIAGVCFSGVLRVLGGRMNFHEMSIPRFAGWGALGGVLFSGLFVGAVTLLDDPTFIQNLVVLAPVFGVAGAGTASGALALARSATEDPLLEAGPASSEIDPGPETAQLPVDR